MFYIKKLTISGNQVKESAVDFKKGLNIIYGPSQCGKTMVAECIDFILGAKNFPIDINSNYNCIKVVFSAGYRDISITRYANQNKVKVESQIDDIYSGIYPLDSKNSNSLNYLYLKLMGIYNPVQIYKSKDLVKQRLTYRTFSFLQIIKESVVHTKKSIFDNPEMKNTTALKAALIYLLSEQNYINDNDEDNKKKKTKKSAVAEYVKSQLQYILEKKDQLKSQATIDSELVKMNIEYLMKKVSEYNSKLSETGESIKKANIKSVELGDDIYKNTQLLMRYKSLNSQYDADIRRLEFLIDGEGSKNIKPLKKCPFCNGELHEKEDESCINAAKIEIAKILPLKSGLLETINALDTDIKSKEEQKNSVDKSLEELNEKINEEIKPAIDALEKEIHSLQNSIAQSEQAKIYLEFEEQYTSTLNIIEQELKNLTQFDPNQYLNEFKIDYESKIRQVLEACHYDNLYDLKFSLKDMDVLINGQEKELQGKGFRAFINSAMIIAFHELLKERAYHTFDFLIIDSPILSLKEVHEGATGSMKSSLFRYLMNQSYLNQVIIVENDIPNLNYEGVNLIHFTREQDNGRYGLLEDYK